MQKRSGRIVVFVALLLGIPAAASAQGATSPRWFVGGLGGLTFGTVTSGAFGAQGGVRIAPGLFVITEVGHMQNVLPKQIQDDLENEIDNIIGETGLDVDLELKMPATYWFAGLRWVPTSSSVAPFLEGGFGNGRLSVDITKFEIEGQSFLSELIEELGDDDLKTTEMLFAIGGGVTARLGQSVSIDAGYRFMRVATEDPAVNTSMVYAAIKFGR